MIPFTETQKFKQIWLWAIVVLAAFGGLFVTISTIDNNKDDIIVFAIVASIVAPLVLIAMLAWAKLETTIDQNGISVQFKPFIWKTKNWSWNEIVSIEVREYSPLKEYGGWGMRNSFRNGKAYNVSGKTGIQLTFTNGKKLLIGTQKGLEVEQALKQFRKN